jgi:hypothetical protein
MGIRTAENIPMGGSPAGSTLFPRLLLIVAYIAAAFGYNAWVASQTVLDPGATRDVATTLLASPAVQRAITEDVSRELQREVGLDANDPAMQTAINAALHDPRVTAAFAKAAATLHDALISGGNTEVRLNTLAPTDALQDAIAQYDPQLAAEFASHVAEQPLDVELGGEDLPTVRGISSKADAVTVIGIVTALLLGVASLVMLHDRKHFGRLGRRIAYLALLPALGFVLLPSLLDRSHRDGAEVAGAVLRTYRGRIVPSVVALAVVGLVVFVAALVWPRRRAAEMPAAPRQSYAGPTPTAPPPGPPTQEAITEKLYL